MDGREVEGELGEILLLLLLLMLRGRGGLRQRGGNEGMKCTT